MTPDVSTWILALLLVVAAGYDVLQRRIPNPLIVMILTIGLGFALLAGGISKAGTSLLLVGFGLALWVPLYAFRMMGAGDVKLFAASSAWLATIGDVFSAAIVSALVGGVVALVWIALQGRTIVVVGNLLTFIRFRVPVAVESQHAKLPYGVAMGIGILWTLGTAS